jgi:pimeloyl-ACP methyl ester carboxylesterase
VSAKGRPVIFALAALIAVYGLYAAFVARNQNRAVFPGAFQAPPGGHRPATSGAVIFEPPGPATEAVAFLFHGNFERAGGDEEAVAFYLQQGVAVVAIEYPGYENPGNNDAFALSPAYPQAVVDAAFATVKSLRRKRTLLDGRSIGGFVAVAVARKLLAEHDAPVEALVLRSTGARLCDRAWSVGLPPFLCRVPYDNREIPGDFPVFVVHGTADEIFPVAEARRITPPSPRGEVLEVAGGMHNTTRFPAEELARFLAKNGLKKLP